MRLRRSLLSGDATPGDAGTKQSSENTVDPKFSTRLLACEDLEGKWGRHTISGRGRVPGQVMAG